MSPADVLAPPWRLMSRFVLRSTGFPFDLLDRVRMPAAAELAARIDALDDELARQRRPQLVADRDRLAAGAADMFAAELARARAALRELAGRPDVQEALWLSNPGLVDAELPAAWRRWDVDDPRRPSRTRRWERRLYSYLQRLAAKNDTTSFFGPLNYGGLGRAAPVLTLWPDRITGRRSFLAYRAGQRLAAAIAADPGTGGVPVDIPESTVYVLAHLRASLAALPASPATRRWTAELTGLAGLADEFARTPWPDRRAPLDRAQDAYVRLTGDRPTAGDGTMFRDRTLLYEECRGDVAELDVGPANADRIRRALAPVLDLAAGYTVRHRDDLRAAAGGLLARGPVPFPRFLATWRRRYPDLPALPGAARLERDLADLVAGRTTGRVCRLAAAEIAAVAAGAAGEQFIGSPDLMLAATGFDAVARGDFQLVIGELHHGAQPVGWMLSMADDADRWAAELADHLPAGPAHPANLVFGRRMKVAPPRFPGYTVRAAGPGTPRRAGELTLADLQVHDDGGPSLRIAATGEEIRFYPPSFGVPPAAFAPFLCFSYPLLRLPAVWLAGHTPRVEIDDVVFQRRRWEVDTHRLPGQRRRGTDLDAFVDVARLRRELDLPERVYVRSPAEPKPMYLDLTAPFALDLLAHLGRTARRLVFEEMLPGPDHLWLRRPAGRYCSELRTVVSRAAR